ncbi:MAG TPA: hypothetical protein VE338_07130 [Ktedonobacterales bacterium]|jgi:uncharacterized protein involved in response to NO|nr:hypothetical protein [Ktedonobacterales bacterium]
MTLSSISPAKPPTLRQQPFALVTPFLRAALLLGVAAGFALASVLSVTMGFRLPLGVWWVALAQAHGRIQVFGWAGLFVLGVAFHFLPRLRGAPLRWPGYARWALAAQVAGLLLRGASQPLLALSPDALVWQAALVVSGALEALGLGLAVTLLVGTMAQPNAPKLRARPALWSVWPLLVCVIVSLGLSSLVNLANTLLAARSGGVVPAQADDASVTLGLMGFLTPMALAMSARALPLYAGLQAISRRILWPVAAVYALGLALAVVADLGEQAGGAPGALARLNGLGFALLGLALVTFIVVVGRMMSLRGRLPAQVRKLAPTPEQVARNYVRHIGDERARFGPYVALIASAYLWAFVGGALFTVDGVALALGNATPVTLDAARHSLAVGFIALLLAGVSVRMIPGFSGGSIASPRLVTALLWLGNGAALLRVGSLLTQPLLAALGTGGVTLDSALFGLSGPLGLTFAICLAITLWPALPLTSSEAKSAED